MGKAYAQFHFADPPGNVQNSRSRQGKMEKSLVSFATAYPLWEPGAHAKQLLATLAAHPLQATPHFPYTAHATAFQPAFGQPNGELAFCPALQIGSLFTLKIWAFWT